MRLATHVIVSVRILSVIVDSAGNYIKFTKRQSIVKSLYFTNWPSDEEHTF